MKFFVAVLAIFVSYQFANSQFPAPRCIQTPIQWHGHFREIDYDTGFMRFAQMDYDAELKRIHIIELERNRSNSRISEEWVEFQERVVYVRTFEPDETCSRHELADDITWRPFGVPPFSRFIGREWLGGERIELGLEVDEFVDMRDGGYYHGAFVPVPFQQDERTCVPVLESYIRTQGPFRDLRNVHYEFYNITTAIPSGVFDHCEPSRV